MKLTKATLKRIIKEELKDIQEWWVDPEEDGTDGERRYDEWGPEVAEAKKVIEIMTKKYPRIMRILSLEYSSSLANVENPDESIEQQLAAFYDKARQGGAQNPQQQMIEQFWTLVNEIV